jgi:hypothetical protein
MRSAFEKSSRLSATVARFFFMALGSGGTRAAS